jgi:hypothetical protein
LRKASHHQRLIAAGPWSFPAPSSALPVTRRALEGTDSRRSRLFIRRCLVVSQRQRSSLPFRASLLRPGRKPTSSLGIRPECPRRGASLPPTRHPTSSPLHRHAPRRPLPARCRHRAFGPWPTRPGVPFRPRDFASPRRFAPPESRGLVASRCQSWGSPRFRSVRPVARPHLPFSRRSYPSKDSIRHQPYPVTRAPAFLTFTRRAARASRVRVAARSLQCASRVEPAFKALLCRRIRTIHRRCRRSMAYPPVGFLFPSKVLRSRSAGFRRALRWTSGPPPRPVSVPVMPAPTGATAAPLSDAEP